jgi:2-keto-4-pentenoate hydratase/2-oxohepta-3-ene-1,7-dioic acid hydratase in catechol pathway
VQLVHFVRATDPGPPRLGALTAGEPVRVVDVARALAARPGAGTDPDAVADLPSLLRHGDAGLAAAGAGLAFARERIASGAGPELARAGAILELDAVRLRAPLPRPGKIVAVARNYAAHAAERGHRERPAEPVLFLKAPSSVIGPDDAIELPAASQSVDYEGELAAVIGRSAREVSRDEALACVAGYTAATDVTARDFQNVRGQHFIGKSCDTFCPLGPALVTADEVGDPQGLALRTLLSGVEVQSGRTGAMLFAVAELVAFASRLMTLEPGDVILTGTPAGVGAAASPPRWLREGDVVEVEIERIGRLRNPVRARRGR